MVLLARIAQAGLCHGVKKGPLWLIWSLVDMAGAILVTPSFLIWSTPAIGRPHPNRHLRTQLQTDSITELTERSRSASYLCIHAQ